MIKYLTKYSNKIYAFGVVTLAVVALHSCTQVDNTLGTDLIDPSLKDPIKIDSTFSLNVSTISGTKFPMSTTYTGWIGTYKDPVFGTTKAEVATQFYPVSISSYKKNHEEALVKLDSVVLALKINTGIGDSLVANHIRVYMLADSLQSDSTYYSNANFHNTDTPVFVEKNLNRRGNGTVRIPLTKAFATKILTVDTTEVYGSGVFVKKFKGLLLNMDEAVSNKSLYQLDFTSDSTRIYVYYRTVGVVNKDSAVVMPFVLGSSANKVTMVSHVNDGTSPYSPKNIDPASGSTSSQLAYVQGLGGLRTAITLDDASVTSWLANNANANIHRAELIVEVPEELGIDYYRMPKYLSAYYIKNDTANYVRDMYTFVSTSTNAAYNRTKRHYSINITSHFKDIMRYPSQISHTILLYAGFVNGLTSSNTPSVKVLTSDYLATPTQAILGSTDPTKRPFKLVVTYSK